MEIPNIWSVRMNSRACAVVGSLILLIMCVQSRLSPYVLVLLLECAAWVKCVSMNDTVDKMLIDKRTWTNSNLMDGVFKAEVVYFLFQFPIMNLTKDKNTVDWCWPMTLTTRGWSLMLPLSHPFPSPVVNQTDWLFIFTSSILKPELL